MTKVLLQGGTLVDATGIRSGLDVLIDNSEIIEIAPNISPPRGARLIDCDGCMISPGLVDLHTHLREPGNEEAETIESGTRAAVAGGYTAVVCMPNTEPPIDNATAVRDILAMSKDALCAVIPAGTITVGREGERLSPMVEMNACGVRLFTDDGRGVQSASVMRRALEYASALGATIAQHCEMEDLAANTVMNEGYLSSVMGVQGVPNCAEELMLERDLELAALCGARIHFMHLSTHGSVELVRRAKLAGMQVTAEVTPHHISLTDDMLSGYNPIYKVNPPLRTRKDITALVRALSDGTIDAIATDHAPHVRESKELPLDQAPPGMIGLETALAVAITVLKDNSGEVGTGRKDASGNGRSGNNRSGNNRSGRTYSTKSNSVKSEYGNSGSAGGGRPNNSYSEHLTIDPSVLQYSMNMVDIIAAMSWKPAAIAGLDVASGGRHGGPIVPGAPANLTVFDPSADWRVDAPRLLSKSGNSPFDGLSLTGKVRHTIYEGEPVYLDGRTTK